MAVLCINAFYCGIFMLAGRLFMAASFRFVRVPDDCCFKRVFDVIKDDSHRDDRALGVSDGQSNNQTLTIYYK